MGYFLDNFTDANGTGIASHTADTGESWSANTSFKINDNKLYVASPLGSETFAEAIGVTSDPASTFTMTVDRKNDTGEMSLLCYATDTTTGIFVQLFGGDLKLWTFNPTALQGTYTLPAGSSHVIGVRSTATEITVSHNGVDRLSYVDSGAYNRSGKVYLRGAAGANTTQGYHLDSLEISDPTSLAVIPHHIAINHLTLSIGPPVKSHTDSFTDTNGVLIENHTSDSGDSYGAGGNLAIHNNRVYPTTTGTFSSELTGYQSPAEYKLELDLEYLTQVNAMRVAFASEDASNFYTIGVDNDVLELERWDAGVPTSLGTHTLSAVAGPLDRVSVFVTQTDMQVYYGTTQVITSTDSTFVPIGGAYIHTDNPATPATTSTGYHLDYLRIGDPSPVIRQAGTHTLNVKATAPDLSTDTATGTLLIAAFLKTNMTVDVDMTAQFQSVTPIQANVTVDVDMTSSLSVDLDYANIDSIIDNLDGTYTINGTFDRSTSKQFSSGDNTIIVTVDKDTESTAADRDWLPATGWQYVDVTTPDPTSEIVAQYAAGPILTGYQGVIKATTNEDAVDVTLEPDLNYTFGPYAGSTDQTTEFYAINASGTVLAEDTITFDFSTVGVPVLSSPTGTATGAATASGTVTTDDGTGTLYFYASTNSTETAAPIKASGSSQVVGVAGSQGVGVTGLTPETLYYLHYVQDNDGAQESNVVSSSGFTTLATSDVPATSRTSIFHIANYLRSLGTYNSSQCNELVVEWLVSEGITRTQVNQMLYGYLGGLGYTGSFNDRLKAWSEDV